MQKIPKGKIIDLPRGGYLLDTSIGYIQIGSPPETIKDTMFFEKGVPLSFCLPKHFFHRNKGISVAEVEFPLYFNFFIRKLKTTLICSKEHKEIFYPVLYESLFGPAQFNLKNDFSDQWEGPIPEIKREMDYFRNNMEVETLVDFKVFDDNGDVTIGDCNIHMDHNHDFYITDRQYKLDNFKIPGQIHYNVTFDLGAQLKAPFKPPKFAITCLGPSHGFDPEENTSGFIIWINHRGIMVDPPVNSTEWLKQSNVNPKLIDSIILTHTHADHDAGTFQKILEEEKITIYSTKTVMDSWIEKYSLIAQIDKRKLCSLFHFHPVLIGSSVNIDGAWFSFHYTLHSIPTIGFRMSFRDKSFVYTSDHLNHPETYKQLLKKNVLTKHRYKELMNFPWDADLIYHEAGVPPLHTPVAYLNSMPAEIQKKIVVYHISTKDFPKKTDLTLATFGIGNSIYIPIKEEGEFNSAFEILDIFSRVEYFKSFTAERLKDLVSIIHKEKIKKGTHIIKKGEIGDKFYIIISGSIRIGKETGHPDPKRFGTYQCFGEVSLLLNTPRTADVYAETDIEALTIIRPAFLNLIKGTNVDKKLRTIALNRDMDSWEALCATELFNKLTASQKTEMELLLLRQNVLAGRKLIEKNKPMDGIYIFHSGDVVKEGEKESFKKGDFVGDYTTFNLDLPSKKTYTARKDSLLFKIKRDDFKHYILDNPGVYLRFFETLGI